MRFSLFSGFFRSLRRQWLFLSPKEAPRPFRLFLKTSFFLLCFLYFAFVATVLFLRYSFLPNIENYRPVLEKMLSEQTHQRIRIGKIEAAWQGLHPSLSLFEVAILQSTGEASLSFSQVDAVFSWASVLKRALIFSTIHVHQPNLELKRDEFGTVFVAGFPIDLAGKSDGSFLDFLLAQKSVRITNATLRWDDQLRKAPPLVLSDLNFALDNRFGRHRFGFVATPPSEWASQIDIRGDLKGQDLEEMSMNLGQIYAELSYVDLAIWQRFFDYPFDLSEGNGALRAWLTFDQKQLGAASFDFALENTKLRLGERHPPLLLTALSGRVLGELRPDKISLATQNLSLDVAGDKRQGRDPISLRNTALQASLTGGWNAPVALSERGGRFQAKHLDLLPFTQLAAYFPLPSDIEAALSSFHPKGRLENVEAKWTKGFQTYDLKADFSAFSIASFRNIPGVDHFSGKVSASEKGGKLKLDTHQATLEVPDLFLSSTFAFDDLFMDLAWQKNKEDVAITLHTLSFANEDAKGSAQGSYLYTGKGAGKIDLTASVSRAKASSVWRYIPTVAGKDTQNWLKTALKSGEATDTQLLLKGNLDDFPLMEEGGGHYLITTHAKNVRLAYADGWPFLDEVDAKLTFAKTGMVIESQKGAIFGTQIQKARAEIPDLGAQIAQINIEGEVTGPTQDFFHFIDKSPVKAAINGMTEAMRAKGNGKLELKLAIPLDEKELDKTEVLGVYHFSKDDILVDPLLPWFQNVGGAISFTQNGLSIPEITAQFLGAPFHIEGNTNKQGITRFVAKGKLNMAHLKKAFPSFAALPLSDRLSGEAAFQTDIEVNKDQVRLKIESDAKGIAVTLPEPFTKTAQEVFPIRLEKKTIASTTKNLPLREQIELSLGKQISGRMMRVSKGKGFVTERAAVVYGAPLVLPATGFLLEIQNKAVNLDRWLALFQQRTDLAASAKNQMTKEEGQAFWMPDRIVLKTADLTLFSQHFHDLALTASQAQHLWQVDLKAKEAAGTISWKEKTARNREARVFARLKHLFLIPPPNEGAKEEKEEKLKNLPALDLVIEQLHIREQKLGRFELQAQNTPSTWEISHMSLQNNFGGITGKGSWKIQGDDAGTFLFLDLESRDLGKMLDELGYPDALQSGSAQLSAKLRSQASPPALSFSNLTGELSFKAQKGQFTKLQPGAGKLLGLLSLQSLPRRLTLDFKDIFSDGLAFDLIESNLALQSGVLKTDRLIMNGPAANIAMKGEVNLMRETQNLEVTVQPELSGTAALGIAIINPVAGAVTWLAQKALQNPLNKIFSITYHVTGPWADPHVEKVGSTEAQKLPTISE